ncbi:MAG: EAL domain-containing protein [Candidatus Dormibacteria bacterium]
MTEAEGSSARRRRRPRPGGTPSGSRAQLLEARLAEVERLAGLGSWEWEIAADRVTWSAPLIELFGASPGEFEASFQSYLARVHAEDRDVVARTIQDALRDPSGFVFEHRTEPVDGSFKWLHCRGQVLLDAEGHPVRMRGVAQDVTAARLAAEEIQRRSEFEKAVLDNMAEMIVACDADGRVTMFNSAMQDLLGRAAPGPEVHLAELLELYHPDGEPVAPEDSPMSRAMRGETVREMELIVVAAPGTRRTVIANGQNFHDTDGRQMGAVVVLRDVTEQRQVEADLAYASLHDPLTGLPNRTLFTERVQRALERARRHRWSTSLLAINLDDFRAINDRLGHETGDELLAEVARRLEKTLRPYDAISRRLDTVTRLGGDEFCLLCEHVSSEHVATGIAGRVSAALGEPIVLGGEPIRVSACIGITISRDGAPAPDALIIEAETAMRRAKQSGPGHHELFAEEMRARSSKRKEVEGALRRALENGEFRVFYQPKVLLSTDQVLGVEALVRWEHPDRGMVPPLDFIPLAEETGLIVAIGAWVLQQACEEARRWNAAAPDRPPLIVSVNVSGRQFESGLPELVAGVLARTGIGPSTLCLEVTESVVMEDADFAITTLRELKALGVRISIDDFGTGYSSLAYLRRFPLDELKVDKSFVDGLGRDPESTAIVAAVMGMAHALGLTVVAEGVETEVQVAALRNLGCDEAQGYLYSRPKPARELDLLLKDGLATKRTDADPLGSPTVVVVDDAADIRQLVRVSLAAAGFTVHEASRGDEGIELIHRVMPDCVILDVNMPGSSGLEVCRALRADPLTRGMTIVMLTGEALASDKVEAFALGADDYIVKPFAPRDLVSRVTSAMRRRRDTLGNQRV